MSAMEPEISVLIITYNGAAKIATVLEALKLQTIRNFEVLVIVDGSSDDTVRVLDTFRHDFEQFKAIIQPNCGRSMARNRGAAEAQGKLLIFYDDDMEPEADSVEKHLEFHRTRTGLLSGNSIEKPSPTKTDIQNYKAHLTKQWMKRFQKGVSQLSESDLFFTSANCSIRKNDFVALGGFDTRLPDAEDFELALRALRGGYFVYFDSKNRATHHDKITCRSYVNRIRQYKTAHYRLKEMYPDLNKKKDTASGYPVRKLVYWLFANPALVRAIDREWLKWMPRPLRYKIYELVIHALGVEYRQVNLLQ